MRSFVSGPAVAVFALSGPSSLSGLGLENTPAIAHRPDRSHRTPYTDRKGLGVFGGALRGGGGDSSVHLRAPLRLGAPEPLLADFGGSVAAAIGRGRQVP